MRVKREQILIGMAVLASIYGLFALLIQPRLQKAGGPAGGAGAAGGTAASIAEQITVLQKQLADLSVPPLLEAVVGGATMPWREDLLLQAALPEELAAAAQEKLSQAEQERLKLAGAEAEQQANAEAARKRLEELRRRFDYAGYIVAPEGLRAVLNGKAYGPGQEIEDNPGYRLQTICPASVVIVGSETGVELTVPIRDGQGPKPPNSTKNRVVRRPGK